MILIISQAEDVHTARVGRLLAERGHEPFLMDFSHFPSDATVTLGFGWDRGSTFVDRAWGSVDLTTVRSVWWRRPQPFRIPSEISDPRHRAFARTEAREVFGGLSGLLDARWMNVPEQDDLAHRKVFQLHIAGRIGLPLPETLVTNSPEEARAFIERRDPGATVSKAFSGTPDAWRETRVVGPEEIEQLDTVRYAPVILQEYIRGTDIRVTVAGRHVYAAEIDITSGDYPVDFRMNYSTIRMRPLELPPDLVSEIRTLMSRLGLVYGAIDFRRTPEGRYVFLEINPAGQWLFVEQHTELPITEAVAETLLEMDRPAGPA